MKTMVKYLSENENVLVQISASTGRGDFKNYTNVTHRPTQIQLMMMI